MTVLLKVFLIFFGIYFLLKFILSYYGADIMRYFLKRITNKAQKNYSTQQGFSSSDSSGSKGKTEIDYIPPKEKKSFKADGEYIDFEEID